VAVAHEEESTLTVIVAICANAGIAVAKGVAGLLSGSAAMLSEAAHSIADTTNQVLLLVAVKRSARPADEAHPFGYGRERYFWTLLVAVGIFAGGGVFAIYQGIHSLVEGHFEGGHYVLTYAVLGIAFVLESVSWAQAVRQIRAEARKAERTFAHEIWHTTDPTVTTVFLEDTGALAGLVLAAAGVGMSQVTGDHFWDPVASVAIGALLVVIAYFLGRENRSLIIGEAADPQLRESLVALIRAYPEVTSVDELLSMVTGRSQVLVAVKIDLEDDLRAVEIEAMSRRMEAEIQAKHPAVRHFFVDVTADADRTPA
jgi:cation diffusion facilitator family transporter